jgi:hypothetical protein
MDKSAFCVQPAAPSMSQTSVHGDTTSAPAARYPLELASRNDCTGWPEAESHEAFFRMLGAPLLP